MKGRSAPAKRFAPLLVGLLSVSLATACNETATTPADAGHDTGPADARVDGPSLDGRTDVLAAEGGVDVPTHDSLPGDLLTVGDGGVQVQAVALPACDGRGPGTEDCHYRLLIDPQFCSPSKPCDKLLVYWSGGEGGCRLGTYDGLLVTYSKAGYVAVCAQPYTTSDATGAHPFYVEFDRMDHILQTLRARADVKAAWTGNKLLIGGVSHGASGPLIAIANKAALKNHAANWTGKTMTAILANDGISKAATLDSWASQDGSCATVHSRWVGRYGDGAPLLHLCSNGKCYCSNPAHKADWDKDNVQLGSADSPYTCSDVTPASGKTVLYRFVACSGGTAAPCGLLGDVIPDDQQSLAFDGIKACAGVTASYQRYANCPHTLCGAKTCGGDDSLAWLVQQGF